VTYHSTGKLDKVMTSEQFTQVMGAIAEGKYSWACVLILRFGGYNPLHYIPYRTYNRLIKENERSPNSSVAAIASSCQPIRDLDYLEPVNACQTRVRGGARSIPTTHLDTLLHLLPANCLDLQYRYFD
jgi:hypothetical protein